MLRINLLILFGVLLPKFLYSQKDVSHLYLVASHPFYDAKPFPSFLLKPGLQPNALDTVHQLSDGFETVRDVKSYPFQRRIVFVKEQWFNTDKNHKEILILNMDEINHLQKVSLDTVHNQFLSSGLSLHNESKQIFFINLYDPRPTKDNILLGIDLNNFSKKYVSHKAFIDVEIVGNPGACLLTFDGLQSYINPLNGELRIPETVEPSQRPIFSIKLPEQFWLRREELKSIIANTQKLFVLCMESSLTDRVKVGYSDLAILSKSNGIWFKQRIKGNFGGAIRAFDEWIVGTVYSNLNIFDEKGRLRQTIKRESPGKEQRRSKTYKTGMPIDYRFNYFGVYSPGILYMVNVRTKKYLEWNTGQGDSEILLVENDEVYYRVNDEIFKASILKGRKLGKAKLLVKNDIVPDIHWAFLSK